MKAALAFSLEEKSRNQRLDAGRIRHRLKDRERYRSDPGVVLRQIENEKLDASLSGRTFRSESPEAIKKRRWRERKKLKAGKL